MAQKSLPVSLSVLLFLIPKEYYCDWDVIRYASGTSTSRPPKMGNIPSKKVKVEPNNKFVVSVTY